MVSTEQWRAAIGRWVRGCLPRGGGARGSAQGLGLLASVLGAAVVAVLLAIGGVELNPGPPTNGDIIDTINRNHREMIDRIDVLQARVASAEGTVQSLQTANERLARKVDYLENQSRRNNIIVTGIPEQQNESWVDSKSCILGLAEQLGVRLELHDIERAHRTGRRRHGQPRMIVAKLASFRKREELLRAAREYLSRNSSVRVREDLSWAVRQTRKALIPFLQEAKASGRQASIRFDKLVVSGRSFVLGELSARPRAWEGEGVERRGPVGSARGQNPRRADAPAALAGASSRPSRPAPAAVTAAAAAAAPRSGVVRGTADPAASQERRPRSRSRRRSRSRSRRSSRNSASPGRFAADSLERPYTRAMAASNISQQQETRGESESNSSPNRQE